MTFDEWFDKTPLPHNLKPVAQAAWDAATERAAKLAETYRDFQIPDEDERGCYTSWSEGQSCSAPAGIAAAIRRLGGGEGKHD